MPLKMWMRNGKCLQWLAHLLSTSRRTEKAGSLVWTLCLAGSESTCPRSLVFNSVITMIIPCFLAAALDPVFTMGRTKAFLILSTRAHALAWSWLHGSRVKWKRECSFILPGGTSALPEYGHAVKREITEHPSTASSSVAHHQAKCHSSWCSSVHPLWFQIPIKIVNS